MDLRSRIDAASRSIRRIHDRLVSLGFRFTEPAASLPGPEPGTEEAIARIEREVGTLPLAIKLFWRTVGSVDLRGDHPDWHRSQCADGLMIYPPSVAVRELDDFLADKEERLRCEFPYLVPIAPDALIKENISGGMWYNLSVPAVADDPPLNEEPHRTTFCNYLQIAVRCGGFPGLEDDPDCDWPLDQLAAVAGGG